MGWRYTVQNDQGGKPRWWLWAGNGEMVAYSGESFDSTANARRAALHFKTNASAWNYVVFADAGRQFRWHAKARNGEIVATSGESFASKANAQRAADAVKANGGSAAGP
jgi:uncharacterized protein YegP (UPF0339 family)